MSQSAFVKCGHNYVGLLKSPIAIFNCSQSYLLEEQKFLKNLLIDVEPQWVHRKARLQYFFKLIIPQKNNNNI